MAAFTTFSREALERYVGMFDIGELEAYTAIEAGIENSNYFVTLSANDAHFEFVLTITEDLDFDEVAFFNDLLSLLDRRGVPVPNPERTLDGMAGTIFCGKPAWLFPRLPGTHHEDATPEACETIGATLADIHIEAAAARYSRTNPYDSAWSADTIRDEGHRLSTSDRELIQELVALYAEIESDESLPRGIIHGDLFKDNALFHEGKLTGVIDFYHACDDFFVQDIAITLNAWATDGDGKLVPDLARAFAAGYESKRALTEQELQLLPFFRRIGAARFVLTRLLSGEEGKTLKDPHEFLNILHGVDDEISLLFGREDKTD